MQVFCGGHPERTGAEAWRQGCAGHVRPPGSERLASNLMEVKSWLGLWLVRPGIGGAGLPGSSQVPAGRFWVQNRVKLGWSWVFPGSNFGSEPFYCNELPGSFS